MNRSVRCRQKVLLVEDEAIIALQESRELETKGYTVRHVFKGEEAVREVLSGDEEYDVILKSNNSLLETLGYSDEEMRNLKFQEITHPEDVSVGKTFYEKILAGEMEKAIFQKRYIHKNGSVVPVSVATTLIRNEKNDPDFFVTQIIRLSDYS